VGLAGPRPFSMWHRVGGRTLGTRPRCLHVVGCVHPPHRQALAPNPSLPTRCRSTPSPSRAATRTLTLHSESVWLMWDRTRYRITHTFPACYGSSTGSPHPCRVNLHLGVGPAVRRPRAPARPRASAAPGCHRPLPPAPTPPASHLPAGTATSCWCAASCPTAPPRPPTLGRCTSRPTRCWWTRLCGWGSARSWARCAALGVLPNSKP